MGLFDFLYNKEEKETYNGMTLDGQPVFNLSKKESRWIGKSRFIVLGSYGRKDKAYYKNVQQAIKELGHDDKVTFLRDNSELMKFGVLNTPAIVVDGKIVTYGKYIEVEDVKELFERFDIK